MDSFDVSIDHALSLVRVEATGELSQADGEKIITVARTTAAEFGYDLLYDVRQSHTNIPIVEWFQLPRNLEVFKETKTRRIKAAILISPNDAIDTYKFYETVMYNLRLKLRVFFNEPEALEWLKGNASPDVME